TRADRARDLGGDPARAGAERLGGRGGDSLPLARGGRGARRCVEGLALAHRGVDRRSRAGEVARAGRLLPREPGARSSLAAATTEADQSPVRGARVPPLPVPAEDLQRRVSVPAALAVPHVGVEVLPPARRARGMEPSLREARLLPAPVGGARSGGRAGDAGADVDARTGVVPLGPEAVRGADLARDAVL